MVKDYFYQQDAKASDKDLSSELTVYTASFTSNFQLKRNKIKTEHHTFVSRNKTVTAEKNKRILIKNFGSIKFLSPAINYYICLLPMD